MSDETKAGVLTAGWAIGIFIGGIVNGAVGAMIAITATLVFGIVLYSSWLIQRIEKRLNRYINEASESIDREISGRKEPKWWC
jgi:hypothetical protein